METLKQVTAINIEDPLLSSILDTLKAAQEQALSLSEYFNTPIDSDTQLTVDAISLKDALQKIREAVTSITQFPERLQENLDKNNVAKLQLNILDVLDELDAALKASEIENTANNEAAIGDAGVKAATNDADAAGAKAAACSAAKTAGTVDWKQVRILLNFTLLPLLCSFRENCYLWGCVYPEPEKLEYYYQHEFAPHFANPKSALPRPYQLSIVVTNYNQLRYTKMCVESILKKTDFAALNAELVLIDHGSNDGTLEYLKSIPNAKVIHFKHNVNIALFSIIHWMCEGQYLLICNNDILASTKWADNLLAAIKSDPRIAIASPLTPNLSNGQDLYVPQLLPYDFVLWSDTFNQTHPPVYEDRNQIMPSIAIYNAELLDKTGLADPLFSCLMYWNYDFSCRVRRQGYRQILCCDTSCYHFGGITVRKSIPKNERDQKMYIVLEAGRRLFELKYHISPLARDSFFDFENISFGNEFLKDRPCTQVLGLDNGIGGTLMQLRNYAKHAKHNVKIYQCTNESFFCDDLKYNADYFEYSDQDLITNTLTCFPEQAQFDLIKVGKSIDKYDNLDLVALFNALKTRLKPQSVCILHQSSPTLVIKIRFDTPESTYRQLSAAIDSFKRAQERISQAAQQSGLRMEFIERGSYCDNLRHLYDSYLKDSGWDFEYVSRILSTESVIVHLYN